MLPYLSFSGLTSEYRAKELGSRAKSGNGIFGVGNAIGDSELVSESLIAFCGYQGNLQSKI